MKKTHHHTPLLLVEVALWSKSLHTPLPHLSNDGFKLAIRSFFHANNAGKN
jgi:hypothetical protein